MPFQNANYISKSYTPSIQSSSKVPVGPSNLVSKQASLFENKESEIDYDNISVDDSVVDWIVKQTITCSIIIPNSSKLDVNKWVNSMDTLYSKRFGTMKEFEHFASGVVDFLINFRLW